MSTRISELLVEVRRASEDQVTTSKLGHRFPDARKRAEDELKREIAEEVAFSLGKAGRRLDKSLLFLRALLHEARTQWKMSASEISLLRAEFQRERKQAERHLLSLQIQREALGFRSHEELERAYPIPTWPKELQLGGTSGQ